MSKFEIAIEQVLEHEGGYVNHESDPGGETKYGISKRSYPGVDIKNLSIEDAKRIYKRDFWDKLPLDGVSHQGVADKVLDMAVNMGLKPAVKVLQRALNDLGLKLDEDGVFGPRTLVAVNMAYGDQLLRAIRVRQAERYAKLAAENPNLKVFLLGWMRRVMA